MIRELLIKLVSETQCLVYGRDIVIELVSQATSKLDGNLNLLDIGCGDGTDLTNIRDRIEPNRGGAKSMPINIMVLKQRQKIFKQLNSKAFRYYQLT